MRNRETELPLEDWRRVFQEASALGVMQLHLTGGEPLSRLDCVELVRAGRQAGLYVNLITSGLGLNPKRMAELVEAGLDHVQLSFQDAEEGGANEIAGTRAHAHKLAIAELIRQHPVAFTVNIVVHRRNLDRLEDLIAMAEQLQADKLEIANVQYYGWAMRNRAALLPTREQFERTLKVVTAARERLKGSIRIDFVIPDYYGKFPKPCMGGWGGLLLLIDPSGAAMPCHAASVIPGMRFDSVREHSVSWIWQESESFMRFRGEDWMQEPCRTCDRRTLDFGGCRCQAFLLTGDAAATDPVCSLSPKRDVVDRILGAEVSEPGLVYRIDPA
jgi:pyrroloquinoline quinone biosynthesis protein E